MKIRPLQDQVLVKLAPFEETFGDSELIRPDIAKDKPMTGTVEGVGPGAYDGKMRFTPTIVQRGDRVAVPWATGQDLTISGEAYLMIRESDIFWCER